MSLNCTERAALERKAAVYDGRAHGGTVYTADEVFEQAAQELSLRFVTSTKRARFALSLLLGNTTGLPDVADVAAAVDESCARALLGDSPEDNVAGLHALMLTLKFLVEKL